MSREQKAEDGVVPKPGEMWRDPKGDEYAIAAIAHRLSSYWLPIPPEDQTLVIYRSPQNPNLNVAQHAETGEWFRIRWVNTYLGSDIFVAEPIENPGFKADQWARSLSSFVDTWSLLPAH